MLSASAVLSKLATVDAAALADWVSLVANAGSLEAAAALANDCSERATLAAELAADNVALAAESNDA